tara:strand:- start:2272 stop:3270 length:999 start_codon:yes stop_codon:yes gene_type:complete
MKVVITGGAGFLGQRLCKEILHRGELVGRSGDSEIVDEIVLFDIVNPTAPIDKKVTLTKGDLSEQAQAFDVIGDTTDTVFHLGALVSGGAEAQFEIGYKSNLDGTRSILEACRRLSHNPRVVFTSSIAAYGGKLPAIVSDETPAWPESSYGVHKVIGELLINDYTRKGFIDGRSARLPVIVVRPGLPNTAASSWCSGIIREPLAGVESKCPVSQDTQLPCLSPRRVIDALIKLHDAESEAFEAYRTVLLPGLTVTAAEMAESAERHKGDRPFGVIKWAQDPLIQSLVDGWPKGVCATKAQALGIAADTSIDEIVSGFVEDYLDDQIKLVATN